jgi:hypothetical protein
VLLIALNTKTVSVTYDILKGINATVWGGVDSAKKVSRIAKVGLSITDATIGTRHALEDFACQDKVCGVLDVIGSVSSGVGLVLGNIPATKSLTTVNWTITVAYRSI